MSISATADPVQIATPRRFHLLDPLRGVAALAVTLFHCVGAHPAVSDTLLGRLLLHGWTGVFIFFPISGYCIAVATDRYDSRGLSSFIGRRWRRIYPPYFASIGVALVLGFAALPFSRGSAAAFDMPAAAWASMLTLTQVFTPFAGRINPVYWSLCYEEQFYVVMALSLVFARGRARATYVLAVTLAALALNISGSGVPGLFTSYWIPFAAGIGAYYCVTDKINRRFGVVLLALCITSAAVLSEVGTFVSLLGASMMLGLAPVDSWLASRAARRWLQPVFGLGLISYSLYLTHVPVGGRVTNALLRANAPVWLCAVAGTAASVAFAFVFFRAVERPFLTNRVSAPQRPECDRIAQRCDGGNAVLEGPPRFA